MNINRLEVYLMDHHVGTLAMTTDHLAAFSYTDSWIRDGFAISPFSLPLEKRVYIPSTRTFQGLWGVFADSLPDAWGQLLVNRMLLSRGFRTDEITPLDRLSIVGKSGMGALEYVPAWGTVAASDLHDLDQLATECSAILNHEDINHLDDLFSAAGSSGGARPKIMTDEWIIKFPVSGDLKNVGIMEKEYMDCAALCGIQVPETKIFPSDLCEGYFGIRRFDRVLGKRVHMLTAAALLEADWRSAATDYHSLMKLTCILSRGNKEDILQMYRRMCFNVYAHNRDDHLKNFTWIYDAETDSWHPSPAYDLTWSSTYYGEHTVTVNGNGANPDMEDLIAVGSAAGIVKTKCRQIAEAIQEIARPLEQKYRNIRS